LGGKAGRKITTSRPDSRAASSAHESGPWQPPETITEGWDSVDINDFTLADDWNFLDPTTPTLIEEVITTQKHQKSSLRSQRRSFMGCFSLRLRNNIDYAAFKKWKNDANTGMTKEIAEIISGYITNYYDFITTAPPSKNRNLETYCCFALCRAISDLTHIPFVISFQQRKQKSQHGRFASMKAERPLLVPGWNHTGESILFVDDFITSGMTAKSCYDVLRSYDNHVDGLIYCAY